MRAFPPLCWISLSLAVAALAGLPAPLEPAAALRAFSLAEDLKIELVAAEPLVASPCALAFDEKGHLFVAENRGYPDAGEPPQGVIALLQDTDGDGRMDRRNVFADGLTYPNGVLPWKGGVIVTCAPDVLFLRDTDGDGRADEKRVLLTGFATTGSTQLRVNAPTFGPDGWIYLAAGLSGGTITCPEHPERAPLKMTSDVRFHPETLEVEAVDGRSQFGQSFDEYGRRFICMNRLPVQQVVLSSRWLARNPNLAFSETVQDCNERSVRTGLKGGGDGVRLFPISSNITTADSHQGSFSAACGITIWRGGALPGRYDGCALSCDPTGNLIHVDRLESRGAACTATPLLADREMVASRDDWFRPVFLTRGPDGALYVADMYRKVIEHPDYLPEEVRKHTDFETGKTLGRIWRVSAKAELGMNLATGFKDEWSEMRAAAKDRALAERIFARRSARQRFCLALALGDSREAFALDLMAQIAALHADDKWIRAAVVSGIAGREVEFLHSLWPYLWTRADGAMDLMAAMGRTFPDAETLTLALRGMHPEVSCAQAALWVGFGERHPASARAGRGTPTYAALLELAAKGLRSAGTPSSLRTVYARLLATGDWEHGAQVLQASLQSSDDEELHAAVVRSLIALDPARAAEALLTADRWTKASPSLRETTLATLLARGQYSGLLTALESGRVPPSALTGARRDLFLKHKDAAIRDRAGKLFAAAVMNRDAALERARQALALPPRAGHGREVFKQLCATCHRLEREGVTVGPDLLDIRRQPKENILFHIVVPDAEVAPAFTAYTCETRDGRGFTGILASETPTSVTIRQPGGQEETILRSDLKRLEALPGTLMPTGLDAAMPPQDLADLLAFLKGEP